MGPLQGKRASTGRWQETASDRSSCALLTWRAERKKAFSRLGIPRPSTLCEQRKGWGEGGGEGGGGKNTRRSPESVSSCLHKTAVPTGHTQNGRAAAPTRRRWRSASGTVKLWDPYFSPLPGADRACTYAQRGWVDRCEMLRKKKQAVWRDGYQQLPTIAKLWNGSDLNSVMKVSKRKMSVPLKKRFCKT